MKNPENKLIEIFCHIDDFNQVFIKELQTHQLTDGTRKRIKPCGLDESEVMTNVIYFHLMRYRDFKHYCLYHLCDHMLIPSCQRNHPLTWKLLMNQWLYIFSFMPNSRYFNIRKT